ncbi:MAG: quinol:cytochrome C oxidoreductase [Planctomycetes bacterium]|nr:quinol:cytochrome C oxidoreductase [Planctomycetota bacterium]
MKVSPENIIELSERPPRLGEQAPALGRRALVVGCLLLIAGLGLGFSGHHGLAHVLHAWLVGATFVLSIALGGLFFVILQHLTAAGWSVVLRRQAEMLASLIPWAAALFLPLVVVTLLGHAELYPWADHAWAAADPVVSKKIGYLNGIFFTIRMALYFVVWYELTRWFVRNSVAQDRDGDPQRTVRMRRSAAPGMLVFALTSTFFAFDALMSLDPHWFSTIFGVYFFAGCAVAVFSTLILGSLALERGPLQRIVTVEHYHDLGKWLFGMVFFWGYIAFSQYVLIWYADIPEETIWYKHRLHGGWQYVSALLLFGHLLVPFAGLLSRHVKRNRAALGFWAVYMLVLHLADLLWLVNPTIGGHGESEGMVFGLTDLLLWLGLAVTSFGVFILRAQNQPLIPARDPRLDESLGFENQ